jgi:cbb3-type cytochrome oxidase subunit 3
VGALVWVSLTVWLVLTVVVVVWALRARRQERAASAGATEIDLRGAKDPAEDP